ncbi:MAG: cytochrome c biogenesis protein CcsA [Phycisphaeraceae bacterium]|nr:cytochrome c biogenesis protein CcsA [Phycisphaeraceae bacterium]
MFRQILSVLASLRLTVALLALSMVLIFVGTLAQARIGVWEAVEIYFRSMVAWIDLQLLVPERLARTPWSIPFPGGALLGVLLLINLLAAHAARFSLTRRRVGVIITHAGLVLLLIGEFITAIYADEGLMSIGVGGKSSYVEDIRSGELVVIEPISPERDRVVAIPGEFLERAARSSEPIAHDAVPFQVQVVRWAPNARLLRATRPTPADQGVGREATLDELPKARGVDGAQTDMPAAYVRLIRDGQPLGTWLVWAGLIDPQPVTIGDKTYGLALRFRRTYKPYEIHLIEFRHDKFVGTEIPRNFSSRVRVVDPEHGTDREALIWMNNPLRYRGATFYQASYRPDGSGTVLQVVRNPGAMLPYAACAVVSAGLLWHFGVGLTGFLRRRAAKPGAQPSPRQQAHAPWWRKALPWAGAAVGLVIACGALLRPPATSDFDLKTFASLPVSSGGRIKPVDTAARHVLMVAGGRQSVRAESGQIDATRFLIDLIARPEDAARMPVIRVDHPDLLSMLGKRPEDGGRHRLTLADIEPHWPEIARQAERAFEVDSKKRDPFQRAVVNLYRAVDTLLSHARMREPYSIPPLGPDQDWRPFHDAFLDSGVGRPDDHPLGRVDPADIHPAVAYSVAIMTAYSQNDAASFNSAVRGYDTLLRASMPEVMRKADLEVAFNRADVFIGATTVYVIAFLLICAWLLVRLRTQDGGAGDSLRSAAVGMLWAALFVHTLAIILRIYLQDRPPVTNLYSSAIFVGWASVLFGLILERLYPIGVPALGAASIGFASLIVAHNLGSDGDTMQMMQAVLDSNFWLATHVVTITLGYSATFLAGAIAAAYLLLGVFTRLLTTDRAQALTKMVYGVVCFALLLSFVGTVLGGIWADQSWGRFWGWDPKENGAALVVLICAVILHARWGGLVGPREIMVLAVSGNIVTAWSWFGTNMLGVGLHSYGFMDSAVFWMLLFVASQLAIMSIGLTPRHRWRSSSA